MGASFIMSTSLFTDSGFRPQAVCRFQPVHPSPSLPSRPSDSWGAAAGAATTTYYACVAAWALFIEQRLCDLALGAVSAAVHESPRLSILQEAWAAD